MTNLALFDFDHTLITGDSFLPFLGYAVGKMQTTKALVEAAATFALSRVKGQELEARTFVKAQLIRRLLTGKRIDDLRSAAEKNRKWQTYKYPVLRTLREHHATGAKIVIASGGLDLYLPEMLRDIPHDALICTDIGTENGIVTGEMVNGNCVRARKAERVAEWLADNGPFDETFGYGNYPHDVPMLNLVKHRVLVS